MTIGTDDDPYLCDDDWDEPDEDFDDDFDEDDFECGFIPGDGCLMAGTEDCDFECPYRDRLAQSPHYPHCSLFGTALASATESD